MHSRIFKPEFKIAVDLPDAYGRSALHVQAFGGPPTAASKVKELLEAGANPNLRDRWGQTPFFNACYGVADAVIVKHFLDNPKTNLEIKDPEGRNFLHYAANGAHVNKEMALDVIPLLLSHYKSKITQDELVEEKKENFSQLALHNLVNAVDAQGLTPLHLACMKGCSQTTPEGRIAVIHTLITHGAKQEKDLQGRTPTDLAIYYNLEGLEKILDALSKCRTVACLI